MASLVYHAGALGDFITTLPALRVWRARRPGERIVLLGKPAYASLGGKDAPYDETWDVESARFAPLFSQDSAPLADLAARFAPFSSALIFALATSPLAANLSLIGLAEILRQDPFPSGRVHIVDYHLSLFPDLTLPEEHGVPRIESEGADVPVPADTVALHPGSGSREKNWPFPRFLELSRNLESEGRTVAWIIGPAEERVALPECARAWRSLSLPALASALARCRLFVGNDSGIAHLAAAAGCPTIALFGNTDPVVWAPRGRSVRIVRGREGRVGAIGVEDVLEECRAVLES